MKSERDFLHDLSTPLATALFLIETLTDQNGDVDNAQVEKLKKKLMDMRFLIENRRDETKNPVSS